VAARDVAEADELALDELEAVDAGVSQVADVF
jgi:hypothetical protein